jgi:hypothetical protein
MDAVFSYPPLEGPLDGSAITIGRSGSEIQNNSPTDLPDSPLVARLALCASDCSAIGTSRNATAIQNSVAIGGIADMAGLAAGSTWSRMTQLSHLSTRRVSHSDTARSICFAAGRRAPQYRGDETQVSQEYVPKPDCHTHAQPSIWKGQYFREQIALRRLLPQKHSRAPTRYDPTNILAFPRLGQFHRYQPSQPSSLGA